MHCLSRGVESILERAKINLNQTIEVWGIFIRAPDKLIDTFIHFPRLLHSLVHFRTFFSVHGIKHRKGFINGRFEQGHQRGNPFDKLFLLPPRCL